MPDYWRGFWVVVFEGTIQYVVRTDGIAIRFNNETLFREIGTIFSTKGYCNVVNTGNTNGSAFLGILDNSLRPRGNRIVVAPNRELSILRRSRFGCSRCRIIHAILVNGPHLVRVVRRGSTLCTGPSFSRRSNVHTNRLRTRFTSLSN